MSYPFKPWTRGAFELIAHAERHLRDGADFDRRVALIGFDNAIEVAISTYLGLHPKQRAGREFKREEVAAWSANYHTKLDFLEKEASERGRPLEVPCDEIVYFHKIRNDQYHTGGAGVPEADCVQALRAAAVDAFEVLFGVTDLKAALEDWLRETAPPKENTAQRNPTADCLIDLGADPVMIAGEPYSVSEVLRAVDPSAYQAVVTSLSESRDVVAELRQRYPDCVRPDLTNVAFVHYEGAVYLRCQTSDGTLALTDTDFINDDPEDDRYFSDLRRPDDNATRLIVEFEPYSIANCFDLFTPGATAAVFRAHNAPHVDAEGRRHPGGGRVRGTGAKK